MKKTKIKLDDMERRILVKLLYEKRNELIREGRYTDAIDELSKAKPLRKNPLMLLPVGESHWGIGNFRGGSSACRRRVDRLADPIFARAALFAAQKEQTETD